MIEKQKWLPTKPFFDTKLRRSLIWITPGFNPGMCKTNITRPVVWKTGPVILRLWKQIKHKTVANLSKMESGFRCCSHLELSVLLHCAMLAATITSGKSTHLNAPNVAVVPLEYRVKKPSAVKCVHAFALCGYCDLCGGYLKPGAIARDTGAENQLCPTAAIEHHLVEPYFEYHIIEDLCIGCGKCVKGCTSFGNGSLHLQIIHDICDNCNECAIARTCPSNAIKRIKPAKPTK